MADLHQMDFISFGLIGLGGWVKQIIHPLSLARCLNKQETITISQLPNKTIIDKLYILSYKN